MVSSLSWTMRIEIDRAGACRQVALPSGSTCLWGLWTAPPSFTLSLTASVPLQRFPNRTGRTGALCIRPCRSGVGSVVRAAPFMVLTLVGKLHLAS